MRLSSAVTVIFVILINLHLGASQSGGTPAVADGEPAVSETSRMRQTLWTGQGLPLPDDTGASSNWGLKSVRLIAVDTDMYMFSEVMNNGDEPALAPLLVVEFFVESESYGVEEFPSQNEWILPGGSAFYQTGSFYGGSLSVGDWDEESYSVQTNPFESVETADTSDLRVEGGRIHNDGETVVEALSIITVVHDAGGVFVGSCLADSIGARLLPGRSVNLPIEFNPDYVPMCGFTTRGMEISEELGEGEPYTTSYVLVRG